MVPAPSAAGAAGTADEAAFTTAGAAGWMMKAGMTEAWTEASLEAGASLCSPSRSGGGKRARKDLPLGERLSVIWPVSSAPHGASHTPSWVNIRASPTGASASASKPTEAPPRLLATAVAAAEAAAEAAAAERWMTACVLGMEGMSSWVPTSVKMKKACGMEVRLRAQGARRRHTMKTVSILQKRAAHEARSS